MGWRGRIRWARAARLAGIATGAVASVAVLVAVARTPQAPRLADDIGLPPPGDPGRTLATRITRPPLDPASLQRAGDTLARAVGAGTERELRRLRLAKERPDGRGDGEKQSGASEGAWAAPVPPPTAAPAAKTPSSPPGPAPAPPIATAFPTAPPASPVGRSEFDFEH
jgi:hypothetical protein